MPVSQEQRKLLKEKIEPYQKKIIELKKDISASKTEAKKNKALAPFLLIQGARFSIAFSNTSVLASHLAEKIQGASNTTYLNQARQELSNCISGLNKIFGEQLNSPLTEQQELLENLQNIRPSHKLHLLKEMSMAIERVKKALGESSKWRWSFPDIHYRFITFAKNWFDFKLLQRIKDMNDENYQVLQDYLKLLMEEAQNAAQEFRSRHELSTQEVEDFYKIRNIFEMQRSIYTVNGNKGELERIQTSLDNISEKIENLIAKKEEKKSGSDNQR